ncbi:winged helix-turn-helix transcriptional regulator [Streptomyces sp. CB03234]|uniref:winged helix-turn-helix transcriptional regulator n=1 Tax=Streptomyces sp. (strain CB03234) TaxID=1703937 RepID=UPI00076F317A|nr:winged helix-turn-helix transcriptional regulator [Streptomyces sp. CB03234]AME18008.1 HxlR family transcriptional regulator [Streptomyces sp. CB03234]
MTGKRSYGQFCGLAAGLNVIGERWALLVVRELLIGPARFNELLANLPGLGPNLLSDRLRALTDHGVIEAAPVPGDGRGRQYRLTPRGEQLREPLLSLARWGMPFLTEEDATSGCARAAWGFLAVQAMIQGRPVHGVDEAYEFRVADEVFHIEVRDGTAATRRGPAAEPALVVTTDADTFVRIGAEMRTPFEALLSGRLRIDGHYDAVQRCMEFMGLLDAPRRPAPAGAPPAASTAASTVASTGSGSV